MARSDLLLEIIQSGLVGNKEKLKRVATAVLAEERAKQHTVLASKLESLLHSVPSPNYQILGKSIESGVGNFVREVVPEKKLVDLVLPNEIRLLFNDLIQEHLRVDLLRSYNLEPRNRILLIGPPGNGKTSLAEAIAEALMVPFLIVRYESIIGAYLGETAIKLHNLIEYACKRKCVLFFDEFETLGKERGDLRETGEIKRVVSSLLLQIDSLPSHVLVIGATNHPELLDRAVWRRFQMRMELPSPTASGLAEWLKCFERKMNVSLGYSHDFLSQKLKGYNFSEVEEFGHTVLRQYVLQQPGANIKEIVSQVLKQLKISSVRVK